MDTYIQILETMYEASWQELLVYFVDAVLVLFVAVLILWASLSRYRRTGGRASATIFYSVFAMLISSFVSASIVENSLKGRFSFFEMLTISLPSIFMVIAAFGFFKLCKEQ